MSPCLSIATAGFRIPALQISLVVICAVFAIGVAWYSAHMARFRAGRLGVGVIVRVGSVLGVTFSALACGMEFTSQFWVPEVLFQRARHVYLLERVRSQCRSSSTNDVTWLDSEIQSDERLLSRPDVAQMIAADPITQSLRVRTAKLRSNRQMITPK